MVIRTKHTKHAGKGRREGGRTAKVERVRDLEMGEINDRETEQHGGRLPKTEAEKKRERAREIHQDKTQRHALTNPNIDLEEDRQ